jgi:hypothetical protein
MGLFGTKARAMLEPERDDVVGGTKLTVRWSLPEGDAKVHGARLELSYRNRFLYSKDTDEGGSTKGKKTKDLPVMSVPLFTGPAPVGEQETSIDIPAGPPSVHDVIDWQLRLVVERAGRDMTVERPLDIRSTAAALAAWSTTEPLDSAGSCIVHVDAAPRQLRPGQVVHGTIDITASKAISARSIRAELVRHRHERGGIGNEETATSTELASKVEIGAGQHQQHAFELTVPTDAQPSFDAEYNSQRWHVVGVVDRRLKSDFRGTLEVVVHDAD